MKVPKCKGTRDLSPEDMSRFRLIEQVFRDSCLKWGYQEVKTPTIEYLYLFTSAGTLTPSMLGRVYSFLDWDGWSGERVVLRPDGTIPIARLYIDSLADKKLARLFHISNVFIFENSGKKTRERWQCGAELIGVGSPAADAELISLSFETLKKLKLQDIELRLSHAGFIKALLEQFGLSPEEQAKVFEQVLDGNTEALARIKSGKAELNGGLLPLLNLKGQSSGFLKNMKALLGQSLPEVQAQLDNFINIVEILDSLGCQYEVDIASGAGFEYYTGVIFQFFRNGEKVGGGGRYDALIPAMGGGDIPASGFALYLDRLMNLLEPEKVARRQPLSILVKPFSGKADAWKKAFDVASQLRNAGYVAEMGLGAAGTAGLRWVLELHKEPPYTLWDKVKSKKAEACDVGEALEILEAEDADKSGSA